MGDLTNQPKECSYDFVIKLLASNAETRWKEEIYYFPEIEGER